MLESAAFLFFVLGVLYVIAWSVKKEKDEEAKDNKFSMTDAKERKSQADPSAE